MPKKKKPDRPTKAQCLLAHCHQCLGYYADGKADCENVSCPLYEYMPYREQEPDYTWRQYNPKRKGLLTWEESKRQKELTDEEREAINERLSKAREAKKQQLKEYCETVEDKEDSFEDWDSEDSNELGDQETNETTDQDDDLDW